MTEPEGGLTPQADATAPAPGPAPQKQEPAVTPTAADQLAGKPTEDIESLKKQHDTTVGRLGQELEQARRQAEYYRGLAEAAEQAKSQAVKPQAEPDIPDEEFYRAPIQTTRRLAREELERERNKDKESQQKMYFETSTRNFEIGKNKAMKDHAKLLEGIEKPVEDLVVDAWRKGSINPADLANPETWKFLAGTYRYGQGEYDLSKYFKSASPSPMSPVSTETPSPGAPREEEVILTDEQKAALRLWKGIEEKDFTEGFKAERKKRSAK